MSAQRFPSKIEPNFDGGLMDATKLQGGLRIVKSKTARNGIPYLYRTLTATETTLCFVENDLIIYKLINNPDTVTTSDSDWEQVILMGTTSFQPVGVWDPANVDPELQDEDADGRNGEFYFVINTATPTEVTIPGLFLGDGTTVVDGNLIVSVGVRWVVVANSSTWDAMSKPQSIIDYVAGIVQAHTHTAAEITDLAPLLDEKYDIDDTADHTVAFEAVPDTKIIELEFLKQWYLNSEQMSALIATITSGGGLGASLLDLDVSGASIDADLLSLKDVIFTGLTSIDGIRTWIVSGGENGQTVKILVTLDGVYAQTFPSEVKMQTWVGEWDIGTSVWTNNNGPGGYELEMTKKGSDWWMKIYGPF